MPFNMKFALQLDHRFGSKWLIEELHGLGFCESYFEVGNYKYCYLRNKMKSLKESTLLSTIIEDEQENIDEEVNVIDELLTNEEIPIISEVESNFDSSCEYNGIQYVGDNIDLNIVSINGNTPFHAMGMIKVSPEQPEKLSMNQTTPRVFLKPEEKAIILKAGDIPIQTCCNPKKTGLNKVKFMPIDTQEIS